MTLEGRALGRQAGTDVGWTIESVEIRRLALDLVNPLPTSTGRHSHRPIVLVRVITDIGDGYGECAALAAPTYTEEYADGAEALIVDHLVPRLLDGGPVRSVPEALDRFGLVQGNSMAKAAVEMALLDATLRAANCSLASFLGAARRTVTAGATVGIGSPNEVVASVGRAVDAGYTRVKCKIAPGNDHASLGAVRQEFPDLDLVADANGAYRLSDPSHADALGRIDALGLVALEQPLEADDLEGHATLVQRLSTPVMLDESIRSEGALALALVLRACSAVSVKPGRVGGLLAARRVHDLCLEAGVGLAIGGMLESGIGRAASLACAALPGFELPGDLGGSDRYFARDLTEPHEVQQGQIAVPTGPGLGVTIDLDLVDRLTVRVHSISRS